MAHTSVGNATESCPEPSQPQLWVPLSCCSLGHGLGTQEGGTRGAVQTMQGKGSRAGMPQPESPGPRLPNARLGFGLAAYDHQLLREAKWLTVSEINYEQPSTSGNTIITGRGQVMGTKVYMVAAKAIATWQCQHAGRTG